MDNKKPDVPQPPQTNVTPPGWPEETPQQVPAESEPPTTPVPPSSFGAQPAPVLSPASTPLPAGSAKKSKKKLIIIVIVVLVILIAGAAAVFAFWYQNPNKMVTDGIIQTLQAKTTAYKGTITVDSPTMKVKANLDGAYESGAQSVDADVVLSYGNVDYKVKGSVLIDANTDMYLKIDNLESVVAPLRAMLPEESQTSVDGMVKKLNDKWIKIDATELTAYNPGFSKVQSCISNAIQQTENNTSLIKEIEDNYKKYPFVTAGDKLGEKDGNTGFVLTTDHEMAKSFAASLKQTQSYKTLHDCDNSLSIDENTFFTTDKDVSTKTELWVNTWTHQITTLTMVGKSANAQTTTTLGLNPTFNQPVSIKAPTGAVTLKEIQAELEALQQTILQQQVQSMQMGVEPQA